MATNPKSKTKQVKAFHTNLYTYKPVFYDQKNGGKNNIRPAGSST